MSWHIATANSLPPLDSAAATERIEARLPPDPQPAPDAAIRVLAWRCDAQPRPEDAVRLLRTSDAAVSLLAVREKVPPHGRPAGIAAIAGRLGVGHALALAEATPTDGGGGGGGGFDCDSVGIVSAHVLLKLGLQRLPAQHPRSGGPCAVFGQLPIEGIDVSVVSVALDAGDAPGWRARQMQVLLDRIDAYDRYLPVLIGGDMATTTFAAEDLADMGRLRQLLAERADRLVAPAGFEPMFDLLRQRGYEWRHANLPLAPTGRDGPPGIRGQAYKRLWFFARGLVCDEPKLLPAQDGRRLSMGRHDAISLRIRPA